MQVNRTDERSNRAEGNRRRGIERSEESVRNVAGNKDTLNTQINPSNRQVVEGNPPVFFAFVDMGLKNEMVDPILFFQDIPCSIDCRARK